MMPIPKGHQQWEPEPAKTKEKVARLIEEQEKSVRSIPTGINVRTKIIADLTDEYVAHLELVINALKKGNKDKAFEYEVWANALKQAIAIAKE